VIPGLRETLRIDGTAYLTRDPDVLRAVDVPAAGPTSRWRARPRRVPAVRQGVHPLRLWEPESWPAREELPSPAAMLRAARGLDGPVAEVEEQLRESYETRLW
jgi:hypothetical protein